MAQSCPFTAATPSVEGSDMEDEVVAASRDSSTDGTASSIFDTDLRDLWLDEPERGRLRRGDDDRGDVGVPGADIVSESDDGSFS